MTATQTIPVLDLQEFRSGDRQTFVTQLGQALEAIGFFALINHGVEADLIQNAYRVATEFFALPETLKLRYQLPELNGQRGFTQFGREHAKDHPVPDLKEFWHLGRDGHGSSIANVIPAEVPHFIPFCNNCLSNWSSVRSSCCGLALCIWVSQRIYLPA